MNYFVVDASDTVVNVIVVADPATCICQQDCRLLPAVPGVWIGWRLVGDAWSPPPENPAETGG